MALGKTNRSPKEEDILIGAELYRNYRKSAFYASLDLDENMRNRDKFIKNIEKIIRTSREYREFIKYLKTEAKLTHCYFFNKIPEEINKKLSVEMHHYPFTLYDLVDIVLNKYLSLRKDFTMLSIANEVMENHFSLKVGIIPLTLTAHQMTHNDAIFIDTQTVFGNYKKFVEDYSTFINEERINKIAKLEEVSADKDYVLAFNKNSLALNDNIFDNLLENKQASSDMKLDIDNEF